MVAFNKRNRIASHEAFQIVLKKGEKINGRFFTLFVLRNHTKVARLGIIVSKKHLNRAVDRNLIKRIVRESFRNHLSILTGLDIVLMFKGSPSLEKSLLRQDLDIFFHQMAPPNH